MIRPRAALASLAPVPHGGPQGVADGLPPVRLDFSTNVNAWGPPPGVLEAVAAADVAAYPDPAAHLPRRAAARAWALAEDRVRFVAGSVDAVYRLARTYLAPGDTALVAAPAFGEYARAARGAGAAVLEVRAADGATDPDPERLVAEVRRTRPRLVFVASPSSPLGALRPVEEIDALAGAAGDDALLVLDEAYRSFALGCFAPPARPERDNIVHLRSITKDFALAGLRAAFVVAHPDVLAALDRAAVPWSESTPAQRGAASALEPGALAHLERTLRRLRDARPVLAGGLARLGLAPNQPCTNYLCVRAPAADRLWLQLRRRGIRLRHCASFGLAHHLRIAIRRPDENRALLHALEDVRC